MSRFARGDRYPHMPSRRPVTPTFSTPPGSDSGFCWSARSGHCCCGARRACRLGKSSPASPPVCKILDYGKFKYEAQKKANAARKKQRVIEVKEIKMRPGIDDNDYNIKMRKVREFLDEGDKVKVTMRFRGREMAHQHLAMDILEKVKTEIGDIAKVEQMPKLEGRQMIMVMAPLK